MSSVIRLGTVYASLIEVPNPRTGRHWLTLWGFSDWRGLGLHDGRTELQRDTWFRLVCIVTRRKDEAALMEDLREKILTDPHDSPTMDLHGVFYLGEYPWHPSLEGVDSWSSPSAGWHPLSVPTRPTVASYTCERAATTITRLTKP